MSIRGGPAERLVTLPGGMGDDLARQIDGAGEEESGKCEQHV